MTAMEHITSLMRGVMVDWLVEVHSKFKLETDTMFLTVSILDRFLAVSVEGKGEVVVQSPSTTLPSY